jgi:acetate kinase
MPHILTINGGSSSIKFALFTHQASPKQIASGLIERIGTAQARLRVKDTDQPVTARTPDEAARCVLACVSEWIGAGIITAVAHRVVHGGPKLLKHQPITPKVLQELARITPLDMSHLPGEIALVKAFQKVFRGPQVSHIACFDTAFHRDMPRVAQLMPIPRPFLQAGVRRYGFHGLSYTSLMQQLSALDPPAAKGRVVLAHLGSGASMAAVKNRKPIDTTMAFTPLAGLMMGTRPGDLDPGFLVYLLREKHMTADDLDMLLNKKCGLLGVSEISPDMRDILANLKNPHAREAFELYCHTARKHIAAMAAAMDGIDTLVFAGGIGEHAHQVRQTICAGLTFLGISLDRRANTSSRPIISSPSSAVKVRIIQTDEERVMALATAKMRGTKAQ